MTEFDPDDSLSRMFLFLRIGIAIFVSVCCGYIGIAMGQVMVSNDAHVMGWAVVVFATIVAVGVPVYMTYLCWKLVFQTQCSR